MIRDPWPLMWTFDPTRRRYRKGNGSVEYSPCRYSMRYILPCTTPRSYCKSCYMKQQYTGGKIKAKQGQFDPTHVCDVCGDVIAGLNKLAYVEVTNRVGGMLTSKELCPDCAERLMEWLDGKDGEDYKSYIMQDTRKGEEIAAYWLNLFYSNPNVKPPKKRRKRKKTPLPPHHLLLSKEAKKARKEKAKQLAEAEAEAQAALEAARAIEPVELETVEQISETDSESIS